MEKQDCAVKILYALQEKMAIDLSAAINYCDSLIDEHGLSIYDLCAGLALSYVDARAYHTWRIPDTYFIAFVGSRWLGHFMLAKRQGRKIWVYDPLKGEALLSLFHFFMIWHKTLILLYVN